MSGDIGTGKRIGYGIFGGVLDTLGEMDGMTGRLFGLVRKGVMSI